jgi:Protein of unknown function (DUF1416)
MSCGAAVGGLSLEGVDVATQSVIQGVVVHDEEPVRGAYVRLLDRTGEFTAEVPTSEDGEFRFFAAPGDWTVRTLAPRIAAVDAPVTAARGNVVEVRVSV